MRRLAIAALVLLGCAWPTRAAIAQSNPVAESKAPEDDSLYFGLLSFGVGAPAGAYVGVGIAQISDFLDGHFVVTEVGRFATRVSYGYGGVFPDGVGRQARLSILRTYGDPWRVRANRTLIGPEVRASVVTFVFGFGAYWQTAPPRGEGRVLTAFTFSYHI